MGYTVSTPMHKPTQETLILRCSDVPPVLRRGTHALIGIATADHRYVLGSKSIYPPGIVRLVGGGIDSGEDPAKGAARELFEELGIVRTPEDLLYLCVLRVAIQTPEEQLTFVTHLFGTNLRETETLHPADDLDGIEILSADQVRDLIDRYLSLSTELIRVTKAGSPPSAPFRWSDYGIVYGRLHELLLEHMQQQT